MRPEPEKGAGNIFVAIFDLTKETGLFSLSVDCCLMRALRKRGGETYTNRLKNRDLTRNPVPQVVCV